RDDVDIGPDEYVVSDRGVRNHTARADVDVLADLDLGCSEDSAEANYAVPLTARQGAALKSAPKQNTGKPGEQTQELPKPLENLVLPIAEKRPDDKVGK